MGVITVSLPPKEVGTPLPDRCQKTMRKRKKKRYGAEMLLTNQSIGQCPNKPAGWHRGRAYCAAHLRSFGKGPD